MPQRDPALTNPLIRRSGLWGTLLPLLSLLAVLLGVQADKLEAAHSLTVNAHAAPLPELRAVAPSPAPQSATPPALPDQNQRHWHRAQETGQRLSPFQSSAQKITLALYGRRQVEGG